ncbi:MAG: MBL fold metallo-hydrolase [Corynebacteriales bacterium]|nr:MBL fold metallo-hydrolase [Mycobacteriales bacterium]
MDYTGAVKPHQPQTRELAHISITKMSVGPMDNNAYLLECRRTGALLLIDAANDAPQLKELIGARPVATIITTHRHPDHWQALDELLTYTGARSLAHSADALAITPPPNTIEDNAQIALGDLTLRVIHLGGHTPGSIALHYQNQQDGSHLFTGDGLFPGGPGKTHNEADFHTLMTSLEQKIFARLPAHTVIYPGHGPDSTLTREQPALPQWRARGW